MRAGDMGKWRGVVETGGGDGSEKVSVTEGERKQIEDHAVSMPAAPRTSWTRRRATITCRDSNDDVLSLSIS